jgi:hypothetical protein
MLREELCRPTPVHTRRGTITPDEWFGGLR